MSAERLAHGVGHVVESAGSRLDGSPLAVFLDIDGTLAPIAPRPENAGVPVATLDVLRGLVQLPNVVVAFISGRSADDAGRMVSVSDAWYVGNHGLEVRAPGKSAIPIPEAVRYEKAVGNAERQLSLLADSIPGTIVENKRWSLSLHYRMAEPSAVPLLKKRAEVVAREAGLRTTEGKMVVELRPPVAVDKGTAAVALAQRVGAAVDGASLLHAGDDRTDEDAFIALRALDARAVTIRVAGSDGGHEGGGAWQTNAEFTLASPEELRQLLEWLVARRLRAGKH